eukprot:2198221-Rhodomonas_salina.2
MTPVVSILRLSSVCLTITIAAVLTYFFVKEQRNSSKAAKVINEQLEAIIGRACSTLTEAIVTSSVNKTRLDEILNGNTLMHGVTTASSDSARSLPRRRVRCQRTRRLSRWMLPTRSAGTARMSTVRTGTVRMNTARKGAALPKRCGARGQRGRQPSLDLTCCAPSSDLLTCSTSMQIEHALVSRPSSESSLASWSSGSGAWSVRGARASHDPSPTSRSSSASAAPLTIPTRMHSLGACRFALLDVLVGFRAAAATAPRGPESFPETCVRYATHGDSDSVQRGAHMVGSSAQSQTWNRMHVPGLPNETRLLGLTSGCMSRSCGRGSGERCRSTSCACAAEHRAARDASDAGRMAIMSDDLHAAPDEQGRAGLSRVLPFRVVDISIIILILIMINSIMMAALRIAGRKLVANGLGEQRLSAMLTANADSDCDSRYSTLTPQHMQHATQPESGRAQRKPRELLRRSFGT